MLKRLHQVASVRYQVSVIDSETKKQVFSLPKKRNLLTDSGLEKPASVSWSICFSHAVVGTGTNPVKRDSGAVVVSRAGTALTASANFFEAGDVGRLFKFDSGEEVYISAFTDAQHVSSVSSGTIAAAQGTVWYVERTGLQTEVKRSSLYANDVGSNGSSFSVDTWTFKRTFVFSAESGSVVYNEIGWSNSGSVGNNLFGQDIISGGVSLSAGQQLKVVVELSVTIAPVVSIPYTSVITGWSQDGDCVVENYGAIAQVDAGGGTPGSASTLDPCAGLAIGISPDSSALVLDGSGKSVTGGETVGAALLSYVAGSRQTITQGTFSILQANGNVRSIWLTTAHLGTSSGFRVLLDANETKDSDHSLTIQFTRSWDRELVN